MNYVRLLREIVLLRKALLGEPKEFRVILAPSTDEAHRTASFLVCCHAAVESFLEWRGMELASFHYEKYRRHGLLTPCMLSLINYSGIQLARPPDNRHKKSNFSEYDPAKTQLRLVSNAYNKYVKLLDQNHGLKQGNLMKILLPLGVDMSKFDNAWLLDMDSYGSWRGELAHYARTPAQVNSLHPASEYERVEKLLPGLKTLDQFVSSLQT